MPCHSQVSTFFFLIIRVMFSALPSEYPVVIIANYPTAAWVGNVSLDRVEDVLRHEGGLPHLHTPIDPEASQLEQ